MLRAPTINALPRGTPLAVDQNMPTKNELKTAFDLCTIALETITAAGPNGIPSGHLYAAMMSVFSSVNTYESMIALLVRSHLITRGTNHVLTAIAQ